MTHRQQKAPHYREKRKARRKKQKTKTCLGEQCSCHSCASIARSCHDSKCMGDLQSCLLNHTFFENKRIWFAWAEVTKKKFGPVPSASHHLVVSHATRDKRCARIAHRGDVFRSYSARRT